MPIKTNRAQETMESPLRNLFAVTPHDTTLFTNPTRGLWVGVGGDIVILAAGDEGGSSVLLKNVASGTMLPIQAIRVDSTNTTASSIVGGF